MQTSVLKLTLCLLTISEIQCGPFHCKRRSQGCPSGATCNENDGTCNCPSHLQGDDCSIVKADINGAGCDALNCTNGGVCVKKESGVACACSVYYYGIDCSEKRYQIKCYADEIIFNVNPIGSFTGYAAVAGKSSVHECRSFPVPSTPVVDDNIPDTWEGQVLRLKYKDPKCGKIEPVDRKNEGKEYNATINVQFYESLITYLDDTFIGTCVVKSTTVVTVGVGFKIKDEVKTEPPDTGAGGILRSYFLCWVLAALTSWLTHHVS